MLGNMHMHMQTTAVAAVYPHTLLGCKTAALLSCHQHSKRGGVTAHQTRKKTSTEAGPLSVQHMNLSITRRRRCSFSNLCTLCESTHSKPGDPHMLLLLRRHPWALRASAQGTPPLRVHILASLTHTVHCRSADNPAARRAGTLLLLGMLAPPAQARAPHAQQLEDSKTRDKLPLLPKQQRVYLSSCRRRSSTSR